MNPENKMAYMLAKDNSEKKDGIPQKEWESLADVPAIEESRNQMITNRSELSQLIEKPLLKACEEFYDKNIRTLSTSANKKDMKAGEVYIILDFSSLSKENKKIALQFSSPIKYDEFQAVKIIIPIKENTTPDEIAKEAERIAGIFQIQSANWIPKYTLDDLKNIYGIPKDETKYDDPGIWEELYYDPNEKIFYMSEEHFKKSTISSNQKPK